MMLVGFVISWALVNLPVMILAPAAWLTFWQYNSGRGGDLGSLWYVLSLAGSPVPNLNLVAVGLFALGCLGIAVLIMVARQRPRIGAVFFLVLAAFLLTNKVYSPQYMLWLLPFVVLARPVWRDVADLHRRRDDLLRRHLVAPGRPARPGQRRRRPNLLVRGDHPHAHADAGS